MKFGIGLATALAVALMLPAAALAQGKIDPKAKAAGMADTPALVQAAGLKCTVADAALLGESSGKGADGKVVKSKVYEVACSEGGGYVLGNPTPEPISCLVLDTVANQTAPDGKKKNGGTTCKLPGNADPKAAILAPAKAAGVTCAIDKARWVGASASSKVDVYEVGCADGQSSLVTIPQAASTEKLSADNCIKLMSREGGQCQYFTKDSAVKAITALAAKSTTPCPVSDARWVATKTAGGDFYEVACQDGKSGFMLETDKVGGYTRSIACPMAEAIAGGCTLTNVASAGDTEEVALYNKKAKEIGFACNVSKYRSLGLDGPNGREVVELACSDRQDGAFALLPINAGQKGEYYNCVRSEVKGQTCKLSNKSAVYAKLTNQLQNKGKTCAVANTRAVGQGPGGEAVVEVLCTGGPSYIAVFNKDSDGLLQVQTCAEAKTTGATCTLK